MTPLLFLAFLVLLVAVARERRRRKAFVDEGSAFWCRVRAIHFVSRRFPLRTGFRAGGAPGNWKLLRRGWSRRMWARWCGDVLVVRRGLIFDRTVWLAARVSPVGVHTVPARDARRCGRDPIAVRLQLHDGSVIEVTTSASERLELVGPFLAAALSDLPKAPARRRET
ncbi:hypothetical protein [Actinoplanes sp. GCM10030250]|uniref:hypothetical protein n=1 Tax=Actinoplanes sp. GCM10030250 TaxID=3273376 RepID=UPI0036151B6D